MGHMPMAHEWPLARWSLWLIAPVAVASSIPGLLLFSLSLSLSKRIRRRTKENKICARQWPTPLVVPDWHNLTGRAKLEDRKSWRETRCLSIKLSWATGPQATPRYHVTASFNHVQLAVYGEWRMHGCYRVSAALQPPFFLFSFFFFASR